MYPRKAPRKAEITFGNGTAATKEMPNGANLPKIVPFAVRKAKTNDARWTAIPRMPSGSDIRRNIFSAAISLTFKKTTPEIFF